MDNEAIQNLSKYRIKRAEECLLEAQKLLEGNFCEGCVNRSYYAIFNSLRAVIAFDGVDFKSHSAVIGYFRREYIKSGIFEKDISDFIGDAFDIRNDSDYEDYYTVNRQDAEAQLKNASTVTNAVKDYILELFSLDS